MNADTVEVARSSQLQPDAADLGLPPLTAAAAPLEPDKRGIRVDPPSSSA